MILHLYADPPSLFIATSTASSPFLYSLWAVWYLGIHHQVHIMPGSVLNKHGKWRRDENTMSYGCCLFLYSLFTGVVRAPPGSGARIFHIGLMALQHPELRDGCERYHPDLCQRTYMFCLSMSWQAIPFQNAMKRNSLSNWNSSSKNHQ